LSVPTHAIDGKGIYVLHLELESPQRISVGKLGAFQFEVGHYAYVGSAFGPGGLAARLAHHLRKPASPHWHMDYLRPHGTLRKIWQARAIPACEHQWAQALMQIRGATAPVRGFGSSDCGCRSHLVRFIRQPRRLTFRRHWRRLTSAPIPPIRCVHLG
jgi:Uri superfamily endonuclease